MHDAIGVLNERSTVDKARQRFADNVALLTKFDPELAVMGDREWTNACTNEFIQYMAKKLWLFDYRDDEVEQVAKAVKGYLMVQRLKAEAKPMVPGGRIIHGEICSVKKHCDHEDCTKHWRMNVRDHTYKNMVYTPIPYGIMQQYPDPKKLIGMDVKYYAHITVSDRDETFGFAHQPKLMEVERKGT
jgi:hypothetical protein